MAPTPFILLSETVAFECPYFNILDRHYRLPDGTEHHFFVKKEVDTCCVLARTQDGTFVAVEEYRVGPGRVMTELPAGRLQSPEDNPDLRILQELLEETGYSGEVTKVGVMPTSPYSTRFIHVYFANGCYHAAEQQLDPSEFITVKILKKEEMRIVLESGQSSSCAPGLLAWAWMEKNVKL